MDINYESLTVQILHKKDELKKFWILMDEYMVRDIFPYSTIGRVLSKEDKEWFFSSEYRNALELFQKERLIHSFSYF